MTPKDDQKVRRAMALKRRTKPLTLRHRFLREQKAANEYMALHQSAMQSNKNLIERLAANERENSELRAMTDAFRVRMENMSMQYARALGFIDASQGRELGETGKPKETSSPSIADRLSAMPDSEFNAVMNASPGLINKVLGEPGPWKPVDFE